MNNETMRQDNFANVEDFKRRSQQILTLHDDDEYGEPITFCVKVKKVSVASMMANNTLPTNLLAIAEDLQRPVAARTKQKEDAVLDAQVAKLVKDSNKAKEMLELQDTIISAIMVEPTYEEVKDYLTDNVRGQLFAYANGGTKGLERFLLQSTNIESNRGSRAKQN